MRFATFVECIGVIPKARASIDPLVNSQKRHSDSSRVTIGQRPKTSVCVAILRTDSGMHDQCSFGRNGENTLLQDYLASCHNYVWLQALDKRLCFGSIGTAGIENRSGRGNVRVDSGLRAHLFFLTAAVLTRQEQEVEESQRDNIHNTKCANSFELTSYAAAELFRTFLDDNDPHQIGKAIQPPGQNYPVQGGIMMANQESLHRSGGVKQF